MPKLLTLDKEDNVMIYVCSYSHRSYIVIDPLTCGACCRCQNRPISGRVSRTVRLRIEGNMRQRGHDVYLGSGLLDGGKTLLLLDCL